MTTACERTRYVRETRELLQDLTNPKTTPRVQARIRQLAHLLQRHYPSDADLHMAAKALPHLFGPVFRLDGSPVVKAPGHKSMTTPKRGPQGR